MRKRRDSFSSTNNSLPDVLSMLVNRHKVFLVRISWHLAGFLTFRLNIVTRVWPHRDQFQVYGLDLFLLSRFCRKRETVYSIEIYPYVEYNRFAFSDCIAKQQRNCIPRNTNEANQDQIFSNGITRGRQSR